MFQSAPRAHARGDADNLQAGDQFSGFQSAPRAHARGDICSKSSKPSARSFNPRPALTRGATQFAGGHSRDIRVSIRAPRSRAGRRHRAFTPVRFSRFQSAPRAHARGDESGVTKQLSLRCFNPRPALTRGATLEIGGLLAAGIVSIRAPRSRAGRPSTAGFCLGANLFQSAPRAHARGDVSGQLPVVSGCVSIRAPRSRAGRPSRHAGRFDAINVSIRAPRSRAGRLMKLARVIDGLFVSIRAPRSRAGRRQSSPVSMSGSTFQSAPRAHARGDPRDLIPRVRTDRVSIRAPRSRAGRLHRSPYVGVECVFQSAPRAHARGDSMCPRLLPAIQSFNPRPALTRGATAGKLVLLDQLKFQSAPRAHARGDPGYDRWPEPSSRFQSAPRAHARGDGIFSG